MVTGKKCRQERRQVDDVGSNQGEVRRTPDGRQTKWNRPGPGEQQQLARKDWASNSAPPLSPVLRPSSWRPPDLLLHYLLHIRPLSPSNRVFCFLLLAIRRSDRLDHQMLHAFEKIWHRQCININSSRIARIDRLRAWASVAPILIFSTHTHSACFC